MPDVLILGPVVFTDWSTPEHMPFGGRQAMAVHKLLGGARVIETLGPDDADIHWHGEFYGPDAYQTCLSLDALRAQGTPLPLSFGGQAFVVVIAGFMPVIRRYPNLMEYSITCVVSQNGAHGAPSAFGALAAGVDSLIGADLLAASALAVAQ